MTNSFKISYFKQLTKWVVSFFTNHWKVIVGVVFILGGIRTCIGLQADLETPLEKTEKENPKGVIVSPKISEFTLLKILPNLNYDFADYEYPIVNGVYIKDLSKRPLLTIQVGGHLIMVSTMNLYNGIDIMNPIFTGCSNSSLELFAKNDRLYVSAKFIDFETGFEMGEMNFNRWKLFKGQFLDYIPGDDRFEVKDKQGNIAFSIIFFKGKSEYSAFLSISGYFKMPTSVLVLNNKELFSKNNIYVDEHNNECIQNPDSNWKQKAKIEMSKIKSIINYK